MRISTLVTAMASWLTALAAPALGQAPGCGDLQTNGHAGLLYYMDAPDFAPSGTPPSWRPLPGVIHSNDDFADLWLAYVVPAKRDGAGSLIVKIARHGASLPTAEAASNLRVKLVRDAVSTDCKGRYAGDYIFGWFKDLVRPPVRTDVDVTDYIYYHKTDSDSGQPDLYAFHIDYRDRDGNCIATDDKRNGNRQQFLYGNRDRDNSLVVANIKANLSLVARAYGAPEYAEKLLEDKRTAELHTGYLKYSKLETQLHQYKIPEAACVVFPVEDVQNGESISVTLNNLEQRDLDGKLRPAARRKERTVSVQVR